MGFVNNGECLGAGKFVSHLFDTDVKIAFQPV